MTFDEWATSVAQAWAAPRKFPPVAPIEYVAEKAYWQAQNLCGFPGTLEEWLRLCVVKVGNGEAASPEPAAQAAPPPPALPPPALDDLEAWLNK